MRTDRRQKLGYGELIHHRRGQLRQHIGSTLAHELRAEDHVALRVRHDLDKAALAVGNDRLAVAEHEVLAGLHAGAASFAPAR